MTGRTRSSVVFGVIASLALILPGRTCAAADEQKFHNLPSCDPHCAKYHVVFLLFLSKMTAELDFYKTMNFIEQEIHSCHECGATYHVEIFTSGSNEWRTCCSQVECTTQILSLTYSATINSNVSAASQDVLLVDQHDQYRMNSTLSETITKAMPWTYQKYVFLVTDYGTNTVKEEQKRLNTTASANRVIVRPFIIESENFHKREIMEYYQNLSALPMKNYDQLVKSTETSKACQNQIRQAEFKYPSKCSGPILTTTSTTTSSSSTSTAYNPFIRQDQRPFTTTVAGGNESKLKNSNPTPSTSTPSSSTTRVQATRDDQFSLDFYIFIALSTQRSNQSDYELVQNMTVDMIEKSCNPKVNGSIFIFMPKAITVAVCSWSNITKCTEALMNTPLETAQMNASDIVEKDTDNFAPEVIRFVLNLWLTEDDSSKHNVMLLVTDFVSLLLEENTFFFAEAREQRDLTLEMVVVLDDPEVMTREVVLEHYSNLTSDNLIITPLDFGDLPNIGLIPLSCSTAIITPSSNPSPNSTTTSTTTLTTKTQHEAPNPDDNQIMIAILVSCGAGEENFQKIKDFVSSNVQNCMKRPDRKRPDEIYVYYPLAFINGLTFCHDSSCVSSILNEMQLNNSCIQPSDLTDNGRKENETEYAVRTGFTLLLQNASKNQTANENEWTPMLLIVSDYQSIAFAEVYDKDRGFRTNLSHLEFRMIIANASIDYYKDQSSIPKNAIFRYENYDAMVGKSTKFCPPESAIKTGLSAIAIAAICVASVALLIIAVGIIFIVHYKNKHLDWRKKIMQFSIHGRSPSTTVEELPASSSSSVTHFNSSRRVSSLPVPAMEKRQSTALCTIAGRRKSGVFYPNWLQASPSSEQKIRTVSKQMSLEMEMKTDLWEMPRDQVIVKRDIKLGNGVYGEVFKGVIIGKAPIEQIYKTAFFAHQYEDCEVAVKMLHAYAEGHCRAEFQQEIEFMKVLGFHPNIANMLGCITVTSPMCLILEYAYYGDMARFLRERKDRVTLAPTVMSLEQRAATNDNTVSVKDLLSFAWQVSDGMEYLTELGFIHRDLAARNVLVDRSMNALIGDFGLCRKADNVAYTSKAGRLPIKWMAIESLKSYQFSTKSDVWSFGVLMYEIFTMGMVPYIDVAQTEMVAFLSAGKRLERPQYASSEIYDIMQTCWKERPADRPSFNALRDRLARHLELATEDYGYLNLNLVPHMSRTSTFSGEDV